MCRPSSDALFTQCLRPGKDQMVFPVGKTKEVKQGLLSFFHDDKLTSGNKKYISYFRWKLLPLTPDWIGLKLPEKRMIEVIEELPEMKCLFHFKDIKNAAKYPLPAFPRVIVQLC